MEIGQFITFKHDSWLKGNHVVKKVKAEILDFCHDPLKINESKCGVIVNGEEFGIPFSEIIETSPAIGEQLIFKL